jgi:hypothetical protein
MTCSLKYCARNAAVLFVSIASTGYKIIISIGQTFSEITGITLLDPYVSTDIFKNIPKMQFLFRAVAAIWHLNLNGILILGVCILLRVCDQG